MKKRTTARTTKTPAVLTKPIVTESFEGWVGNAEIAQIGERLSAVCEFFGVQADQVDMAGSAGILIFAMAQHCFPEAFRIVCRGDADPTRARKHYWTGPRRRAFISLVDELREQGFSVKGAISEVLKKYPATNKSGAYQLKGSERSLENRYYEFKRLESEGIGGEPGLPLNPDGTPNFRAAAEHFFSLHEKRL